MARETEFKESDRYRVAVALFATAIGQTVQIGQDRSPKKKTPKAAADAKKKKEGPEGRYRRGDRYPSRHRIEDAILLKQGSN